MDDRLLEALRARQGQYGAIGLNEPDIEQSAAYARGLAPGILGSIAGIPGMIAGQVNTMFQRPPPEPVNEKDYPAWEQARSGLKQQQAEASFGLAGLPIAGSMPFAPRGALGSGGGRLPPAGAVEPPAIPPPVPEWAAPKVEPAGIRAYHGSPHNFEAFDMSKIGTGEGAQAYGHGLYFAGAEDVAKTYKPGNIPPGFANLSAEERAAILSGDRGHLYEVGIKADPSHFLHWDKPLSEQSPHVQEALAKLGQPTDARYGRDAQLAIGSLKTNLGGHAQAAQALREAGIPGIKYLDQGSRSAGEGSHNYVVFNDSLIDIMRKYGIPGIIGGGGAAAALDQKQ